MKRPPCPTTVALREVRGCIDRLSPNERAEVRRAEEAYYSARFGWQRQLRALLGLGEAGYVPARLSYLLGGSAAAAGVSDGIDLPLRVWLAFGTASFAVVLLCNTWIRAGISLQRSLSLFCSDYIVSAERSISHLAVAVPLASGVPMPVEQTVAHIADLRGHVESMADAFHASAVAGAVLALLAYLLGAAAMLLNFRSSVLRARCGRLDYPSRSVSLRHSWDFVGLVITNAIVSFLLVSLVAGAVVFPLSWSFFWHVFGRVMERCGVNRSPQPPRLLSAPHLVPRPPQPYHTPTSTPPPPTPAPDLPTPSSPPPLTGTGASSSSSSSSSPST